MTANYEVTFIVKPTLEEADVDACIDKVQSILTNLGGTIQNLEKLGRRRLAYEIDDVREGFYAVLSFTSQASQMKEFERQLSLIEDVMRSIVIRLEEQKAEAKVPV